MSSPGDAVRKTLEKIGSEKLTKRETIALSCLEGLLAQQAKPMIAGMDDVDRKHSNLKNMTVPRAYAWLAFKFADEFLKESGKKNG